MKNLFILSAFFLAYSLIGQNDAKQKVIYQKCTGFAVTKSLSELATADDSEMRTAEKEEIEIRRKPFTNA
ncbi:MAG: hypothetical protein ACXVC7_12575, partial [Bacteroidia bacterium]